MNSIVMCSVASICATIVHDGGIKVNEMESKLSSLQSTIQSDIEALYYFINNTELLTNYQVVSKRSEVITKPVVETLNEIKLQTESAEKGGVNKTHCYEAAKLNATTAAKHAFDAMTSCEEEYMKILPIIKANITRQVELLNMLMVWSGYTMYSPYENGIDQTITDRLTALEIRYVEIAEKIENVQAVAFQAGSDNSNALDSCLGKFTPSLIADLQNVQSHASACILAP